MPRILHENKVFILFLFCSDNSLASDTSAGGGGRDTVFSKNSNRSSDAKGGIGRVNPLTKRVSRNNDQSIQNQNSLVGFRHNGEQKQWVPVSPGSPKRNVRVLRESECLRQEYNCQQHNTPGMVFCWGCFVFWSAV
jgi:hypothetical protein